MRTAHSQDASLGLRWGPRPPLRIWDWMTSALTACLCRTGASRALAMLVAVCAWLAPTTSLAQTPLGPTIRWQAPASCPQQRELEAKVRKLSGPAASAKSSLEVDGTITRLETGSFHLKLVMRSGALSGERNIDSKSCADLTGAAAVTLALLLRSEEPLAEADLGGTADSGANANSDAGNSTTQPSTPNTSNAPDAPNTANTPDTSSTPHASHSPDVTPEPVAPDDSTTKHRPWRFVLGAPFAALSLGPLERPSWGAGLSVGVTSGGFSVTLGASQWLRQDQPAHDFPGYGARANRRTLALHACGGLRFSAFELAPCVALSVESLSMTGTGPYVAPHSDRVTWFSAGLGVRTRVYVAPWFSLAAAIDGQLEASRPRLTIGGIGAIDQLAPAAVTVTFGPEWFL